MIRYTPLSCNVKLMSFCEQAFFFLRAKHVILVMVHIIMQDRFTVGSSILAILDRLAFEVGGIPMEVENIGNAITSWLGLA